MRRICVLLLAFSVVICLAACGKKEEAGPTEEQKILIDTLNAKLSSEEFAACQNLYAEFTGEQASSPCVSNVTHYNNPDFGGVEMDCYLVTLRASLAYWTDEEAGQKTIIENIYLFIDRNSHNIYDNIRINSSNIFNHDTATPSGRVAYLLWIYESVMNGSHSGVYVNDRDTVTELTDMELEIINSALK